MLIEKMMEVLFLVKLPEFSESTIKDLFKNGYKEALDAVDASYIQS